MIRRIIASTVVVLALSAGVAYAATQLAASDPTQVCVNDANGLMRVAAVCREGEHAMTIGGEGDVRVTQEGTFTVGWGTTGLGVTLPLTGVTVAGKCELVTSPPAPPGTPDIGLARVLLATTGNMTAFSGNVGTVAGQSLLTIPATTASSSGINHGSGSAIVVSNGATATLTFGAQANGPDRTCTYLWQAVEAPN